MQPSSQVPADVVPAQRALSDLGCYLLGGHAEDPGVLLDEARQAEALGLGAGFLSERWSTKEASSLSGAALAVTERLQIVIATTNHTLRHPIVSASWATTMHRLSRGRFTPGIGRGIVPLQKAFGMPAITTAQMEDWAGLMRRLWAGETIVDHDGPAGRYPMLRLDSSFDEQIPLALVAFGPNSLKLGGRAFDDVVLHTFFTEETLARSVQTVKRAAEEAGRDPGQVRVWSCFATVGGHIAPDVQLKKTVARLATYLQFYGDLMVDTNRWDPAVLERFRADPVVSSFTEMIDGRATGEQIEHIAGLIPDEWLEPAATGTPEQCVARVEREFATGADRVILHGATPEELTPVVEAYRAAGAA
ncbi:F420-dependent glucose-6-phosphate dehydrogenase [Paraconexibacter sp. AEG42_29]|uniref:F420-dependent glucose-6-phosphate dehydrogenase n=1 Tax=Paraconexibacter sp. AEG42_29 TaxID=2997339 RepID=A0AAU7AU54_9ACTN